MISIVLPTYNGSQYIQCAVASILKQTYTDIELIIVDDCSTDGTGDIVDNLSKCDKRINVIHNKVNKKLPASLNIGFENAHGNYFTWTSDDNLYKSNALEIMLLNLKENPETDIVYAMYDTIDSDGNLVSTDTNREKGNEENNNLQNWVGACFLYKREVHDKLHGYDENLFLVEDYDFWLRANRYFKYQKINQTLYQYRVHENSLTSTRNDEIMAKTIELLERELEQGYIQSNDTALLYKYLVDYYYVHLDNNKFRTYMNLLKRLKDKHIKVNVSYRVAEIVGISPIRKIWEILDFLERKKRISGRKAK